MKKQSIKIEDTIAVFLPHSDHPLLKQMQTNKQLTATPKLPAWYNVLTAFAIKNGLPELIKSFLQRDNTRSKYFNFGQTLNTILIDKVHTVLICDIDIYSDPLFAGYKRVDLTHEQWSILNQDGDSSTLVIAPNFNGNHDVEQVEKDLIVLLIKLILSFGNEVKLISRTYDPETKGAFYQYTDLVPAEKPEDKITIFTDGGCKRNGFSNAVGSWAYAVYKNEDLVDSRSALLFVPTTPYFLPATSSRAELAAVIGALYWLISYNEKLTIKEATIATDHKFIVEYVTGVCQAKSNQDLINWLDIALNKLEGVVRITWMHVHAHRELAPGMSYRDWFLIRGNWLVDHLCGELIERM